MAYLPPYSLLQEGVAISPDGAAVLMSRELFKLLTGALARASGFDANWYREAHPDVGEAIDKGELTDAFEHFSNSGYEEGRLHARLDMDETWYRENHTDVAEMVADGSFPDARAHYETTGYFEGRPGSAETEAEVNYWRDVIAESADLMQALRQETAQAPADPPRATAAQG